MSDSKGSKNPAKTERIKSEGRKEQKVIKAIKDLRPYPDKKK